MPASTINIPLPSKGVNKYGTRSEQPLLSTPDSLNVLPFDRYGRQRIAQRPGTGLLWDAAIGSGAPVKLVQQAVVAANPAVAVAGATLSSDTFDYPDGALETVSDGVWKSYSADMATTPNLSNVLVSSSRVTGSGATGGHAILATTPAIGTTYIVRESFRFGGVGGNQIFTLHTRVAASGQASISVIAFSPSGGGSQDRITVVEGVNTTSAISPDSGTANIDLGTTFWQTGVDYLLEISWVGNTYTVSLDGVVQLVGSTTINAANTRMGFSVPDSGGGSIGEFQSSEAIFPAVSRITSLVAVAGTNIYMGDPDEQGTVVTGGTAKLTGIPRPTMAILFGFGYLVDGDGDIIKLDIANREVDAYVPSGGLETATTLGQNTIAVSWRGRLVLAGDYTEPHNFKASKVGDPLNWDYAATGPDAAFEGNASTAGQISDPITSLIPASDDILLIGTDHGLHAMRGDITDGGSIDTISDAVGVFSQTSWTKGPDGTLFFVGTTGFFAMNPAGKELVNLSKDVYNQFFQAINRARNYVTLVWDRDRHGCHIFVTPVSSGAAIHLFYDSREGGFWPIQYPDSHGPISACVWDGDKPSDRYLFMGGRTGYIQIASDVNRRDNGETIRASIILGPFQPFPPTGDAVVTGLYVTAGEIFTGDDEFTNWNLNWRIEGGKSAYEVTDGTARRFSAGGLGAHDGRQNIRVPRTRGGWFSLTLSNVAAGNYFSIEQVSLRVESSGVQR